MAIINYIELTNGSETWRIAASVRNIPSNVTVRSGMVITNIDGMLSPGELSEDPVARSYSDGSVWNSNATRSGKSISIPITFYAETSTGVRNLWDSFERFLYSSARITLKYYGLSRTYTCQIQDAPVDGEPNSKRLDATVLLTAKEAF